MNIYNIPGEKLSMNEKNEVGQIIHKSNDASIFHTVEWNKILLEVFNTRPMLVIAKEREALLGCFILTERSGHDPRTMYCSPDRRLETVYGGPLSVLETERAAHIKKELIKKALSKSRGAIVEIWLPPDDSFEWLKQLGYTLTPFYTSIVNLEQNEEDLWHNIHQKTRNQVRKAQRSGVRIIKEGGPFLSDYYKMVKETLGSRGIEVLPKKFYEKVMDILEPKGMAKLFIAIYNDKAIAGAIFLFYKDTVYYWHGASLKQYRTVSPNNLIQWELIRHSHQSGFKKYDLLSIEPDRLPGIARFKMRFGGETKTYYRAFWKTPFYHFCVMAFYIKHPSYLYQAIKQKIVY